MLNAFSILCNRNESPFLGVANCQAKQRFIQWGKSGTSIETYRDNSELLFRLERNNADVILGFDCFTLNSILSGNGPIGARDNSIKLQALGYVNSHGNATEAGKNAAASK